MARKRYSEASGNWHIDVHVNGGWEEIAEACNEEEADGIIKTVTAWLMESVAN